ncbi:MAG TPA: methyltransferase domain-containing protein [Croceibacterium sp.]|nr:methyltransferase domain-containing protein [Croceibacterium sp.]
MSSAPPTIFNPARRLARRRRMRVLQERPDAPQFVLDDMVEDVLERLAFLRHTAAKALVIGDWSGALATALESAVTVADDALDLEAPYPFGGFDLIASLGVLDTVNDLPGALIHIRNALAPGGLAIASFVGAGCLDQLRAAMLAADGERPAARMHPAVDVRAGGQLLQRAGWANPVVDCRSISVSYGSLDRLVADLRAQGLGNVLASSGPPLGKAALESARTAFLGGSERVTERFEIVTLSGWRH